MSTSLSRVASCCNAKMKPDLHVVQHALLERHLTCHLHIPLQDVMQHNEKALKAMASSTNNTRANNDLCTKERKKKRRRMKKMSNFLSGYVVGVEFDDLAMKMYPKGSRYDWKNFPKCWEKNYTQLI